MENGNRERSGCQAQQRSGETGPNVEHPDSDLLTVGDHIRYEMVALDEVLKTSGASVGASTQRRVSTQGLRTGFPRFDDLAGGLQPGQLIVIAGVSGVGKTALVLSMATHVALKERQPVALFSLEMSREAVLTRLLCAEAGVDSQKLRKNLLSRSDSLKLAEAKGRLDQVPIYIDDTTCPRLQQIQRRARRLSRDHGLSVIILDYIQLIAPPDYGSRDEDLSAVSRGLKFIAKELRVPLVAVYQLPALPDRPVAAQSAGHYQLSDICEGRSLQEDADLICFLHREECCLRRSGLPVPPEVVGRARLIVAKHRNGQTGTIPIRFVEPLALFENEAWSR